MNVYFHNRFYNLLMGLIMVLITDGNSDIGAHVGWSSLFDLHKVLVWPKAVTNQIIWSSEKTYFPTQVRNMSCVTISYKYHGSDELMQTFFPICIKAFDWTLSLWMHSWLHGTYIR